MQNKLYNTYSNAMGSQDTYEKKQDSKSKGTTNEDLISKVLANPKEYYDYDKKKFSLEAIQDSFNLNRDKAYNLIRLLKFKQDKAMLSTA